MHKAIQEELEMFVKNNPGVSIAECKFSIARELNQLVLKPTRAFELAWDKAIQTAVEQDGTLKFDKHLNLQPGESNGQR